jgi:hypothetical protein
MHCQKTSLPGGVNAPTSAVKWMFDAILSFTGKGPALGCFPAITELDLDLSEWEEREREDIIIAIRKCAIVYSLLRVWEGSLPGVVAIKANELGQLFGLFKKLETIHLRTSILLPGIISPEDDMESYAHALASRSKTLQKINFIADPPQANQRWAVPRVLHGWGGQNCTVHRCVDGIDEE